MQTNWKAFGFVYMCDSTWLYEKPNGFASTGIIQIQTHTQQTKISHLPIVNKQQLSNENP